MVEALRLALGLRSTAQFLGRLAVETEIFERLGVDVRIVAMETAAPAALAGLTEDAFDIAEIGAVPIVDGILDGRDPVIVLAPEPISALFIVARRDIETATALTGGRLGVLSESGQTGVSASAMLHRWGLDQRVGLAALGTYPAIFAALADGTIEAGLLTADWRFAGERPHGMHALVDLGETFGFQGPVVATTRRLIADAPDKMRAVVAGYVEAIRLFKTDRKTVLPLLAAHLGFEDADSVAAAYDFYVPRFQDIPRPSIEGIQRVIDRRADNDPAARAMTPDDVCDLNFLDEIAAR